MKRVIIFDTTLRDGEQSPGASLTIQEKLEIARQLEKLGVDIIEAGFPISSDGDFESVKLISKEIKNSTICALARVNKKDIDRAYEALKEANKFRIHIFMPTSDIAREDRVRKSKEEIISQVKDAVLYAKNFFKDIEFSTEDASRTNLEYMTEVIKAAIEAGATTINIPDTVGYSQPKEYGKRFKHITRELKELIKEKNIILSAHCHNDLGLAVANSLEAIKNGARQVECTINGIGERAGNCSLEEFVMNLNTRKDFFKNLSTNINTKELFQSSKLVSKLTGLIIQRNKAIVGENAFSHEAGIHQHGIINNSQTYEIMNPEDIGWIGEKIVLGKHSGKHAVDFVLKKRGFNLSPEEIEKTIENIKTLADTKKNISEEDVLEIVKNLHNL